MAELEIQAFRIGIDDLLQRPGDTIVGEPNARLSHEDFEAYKKALLRLGVHEADARACQEGARSLSELDSSERNDLVNMAVDHIIDEAARAKLDFETTGNDLIAMGGLPATTAGVELLDRADRMHRILTMPRGIISGVVSATLDNTVVNAIRSATRAAGIEHNPLSRQSEIGINRGLPSGQVVYQEQEIDR